MKNESGGKIMAKFVRLRAKVKDIMFFLKKLTRLLLIQMMIRKCNQFIP